MTGQTITLQFGPTAERFGNYFWNGQEALVRWAEYRGVHVDSSKYFANCHGLRTPRLVSLLPTEAKEIIGDMPIDEFDQNALEQVQLQTAASPKDLFPHITLNKRTVQRTDIESTGQIPFYDGIKYDYNSEELMDSIRYFAEECDSLGCIQAFSSDDKYGGCGARLMELVMDEYEKKSMVVYSVPHKDLKSSWESKALSLYANKSFSHIPFALMKPDDLQWTVSSYEPLPIFASAIDTICSSSIPSTGALPSILSVAYGMRMECDASDEKIQPVIDLMSFSSPSFESISFSAERVVIPSYVKMNGHGYIPHHTIAALGTPSELPDYFEDICGLIKDSRVLNHLDKDIFDEVYAFLLNLADK